ncbi:unnamed protein product [Ascophyllum nodosum]
MATMYLRRAWAVGAAAALLTASESCGFIATKRHRHSPSDDPRFAPSFVRVHNFKRAGEGNRRGETRASGTEDFAMSKPGMATQLGGWSYARTVFFDVETSKGEGYDEKGASRSAGAGLPQESVTASGSGGSGSSSSYVEKGPRSSGKQAGTAKSRSAGVGSSTGGDDDDGNDSDDDADAWNVQLGDYSGEGGLSQDAQEHADEEAIGIRAAVGGSGQDLEGMIAEETFPTQEFEVICDGDVCERKPVTSPKAMQTAVDASEGFVEQHAAAADTNTRDSDSASVITPGGDGHGEERNQSDDAKAMDPGLSQLVSMGWDIDESATALADAGGNVLAAAEELAAREEEDLERYENGLAELKGRGWDEDVAMSAMREAGGNSTAALLALEEEDRALSMQFEQSIEEMVEHGWDKEVARKALLMQWQKDIESRPGTRKAQKQFEKTVKGVKALGQTGGTGDGPKGGGKTGECAPAPAPAPAPTMRKDVVFEVTDKNLQKVVIESKVPVILDVYAEWCGPCKQLTPALEEAAIKSGGMFRVAKVDAEKQRNIAEVLGIKAYPSVFGVKDGILVDNFVGVLPQDEMQSFMMGVIMGTSTSKDKPLRDHQRSQTELRSMSRKLAHIAGLAALGSRKKENLCLKVDKTLSEMLPGLAEIGSSKKAAAAVASGKRAARTVIAVLMAAYKFPENPKFRRISTSSTLYTDVLAAHPPMLEVLSLAGFRRKEDDQSHLNLLHRNVAVLAAVQDRVELWNRSVKVPISEEDRGGDEDSQGAQEGAQHQEEGYPNDLSTVTKLQITKAGASGDGGIICLEMAVNATLGDVFQALQEGEVCPGEGQGGDLVLTTSFPKRMLSAADPSCWSSTLLSLGLVPSARLTATDSVTLAAAKMTKAEATPKELRAKIMDCQSQEGNSRGRKDRKKAGTLFGAKDGIIGTKTGKHREYFGGDSTVTLAAQEEESYDTGNGDDGHEEDNFGDDAYQAGQSDADEKLPFLEQDGELEVDERTFVPAEWNAVAQETTEEDGLGGDGDQDEYQSESATDKGDLRGSGDGLERWEELEHGQRAGATFHEDEDFDYENDGPLMGYTENEDEDDVSYDSYESYGDDYDEGEDEEE